MKQSKYPELNALRGLLAQYHVTQEELSGMMGRSKLFVHKIINGYSSPDLDDCKEIQKILNSKSKQVVDDKGHFKQYTLDEIFFTQSAEKTKQSA